MFKAIQESLKDIEVVFDADLKKISSFGIGGRVEMLVYPKSIDEILRVVSTFKKYNIKYKVVGNSTNILYSDEMICGAIVSVLNLSDCVLLNDDSILVSSGMMLNQLVAFSKNHSLTGLEFLAGIPGTVGGAIYMNAGCFGDEISNYISSVAVLDDDKIILLEKSDINFGYRTSVFQSKNYIILFAELKLKKDNQEKIVEKINFNLNTRRNTQPSERSAGCVFKKCDGVSAGLMIDNLGLKGRRVGGAKISEIHANFIVNCGTATAKDVKKLISIAKQKVLNEYNKELELEIEIVE